MKRVFNWKIVLLTGLFFAMPVALLSCGSGESVADHCVGSTAPTTPSEYQFDLCVFPHTIQVPGSVTVTTRVWDRNGNVAGGVPVIVTGPEKPGGGVTNEFGILALAYEIKGEGGGGSFGTIASQVENGRLQLQVYFTPDVGLNGRTSE